MNNHMSLKLVGANSSLELNSPITSIYLQEELTGLTTLPGIRETKGMNIGMNGGWTSAQFYEPRLITIKGVIANQNVAVVEQRRKQLIQLLAEKRLALEFQTEAGNHYTMNVVVAGAQMPLSKVLTASYFQLNLRADDPLIYDNNALAELEAILRRSSSASSGFSINFPINFQLGVSESRPTIDNFGSSVVYPVITLTGPLTTPEVVNITTNMAFTIDEVLSAGAYTTSGIRGVMTQEGTVETASGSAFQITGIEGAPLTLTELTGNAEQTTYSGKNLADLVPMADGAITGVNYATAEIVNGTTLGRQVLHMTATGAYPTAVYTLPQRLESGKYYSMTIKYRSSYTGTGNIYQQEMWIAPNWRGNNWDTLATWDNGKSKNQDGVAGARVQPSTIWTTKTFRFYIDPTQYTSDTSSYSRILLSLGYGLNTSNTSKEVWIADIMLAEITQAQWDATTYADEEFEPYVGGTASPNPDYPRAVNTVTGEQTVKITGKNLFDLGNSLDGYFLTSGNGITIQNEPASLRVGATFTPNTMTIDSYDTSGWRWLSKWAVLAKNTNYIMTATSHTQSIRVVGFNSKAVGATGTIIVNFARDWEVATFNSGDYDYYLVSIYPGGVGDVFSEVQLELGSTATTYEPYQGEEYQIDLSSKNLFDKNAVSTGKIIERTDGTLANNASYDTSDFMPVKAGEKYTYTGFNVWYASYYDTNKAFVSTPNNSTTITIPTGVAYVRCSLLHTNLDTAQFEHGTQATTYAEFYNYELTKIGTYQDRIYKDDGKWYVEKQVGKVVLNGTQSYLTYQNDAFAYYNFAGDGYPAPMQENTYGANANILVISDHYTGQRTDFRNSCQLNHIMKTTGANSQIAWKDTRYTTAEDMTTWLASNPTTVYYALATPTTTEITNSTLLSQLNFIANLYGGTNNIMLVGTGAQGEIAVRTGQIIEVIDSLSIVGTSGSIEINLNGSELAAVGSVTDELAINGTTGAVTKTARIGKIASYAGETITTDYISTTGGLDTGATIYYVLPSSSTSTLSTLDSTALASFNGIVASGGVSAQTNIGSISVDVTTLSAQDVAVVDTKQHTVTINGVGAYSKFSGDWLALDVGLNELQLITENNTDTGSAVIKYRVGYMGV